MKQKPHPTRDISAESQQITFPEHRIGTTALGEDTGTHDIAAAKDAVIIDTVSWEGLIPGLEYELQGVVIDKETGAPYPENEEEIRVSAAFTPQETEGTTEMRFQLDTSGLEGKDFVIFEYLYQDGTLTASHEDVNDKDQTVHVLASDEVKKRDSKNRRRNGSLNPFRTGGTDRSFRCFRGRVLDDPAPQPQTQENKTKKTFVK